MPAHLSEAQAASTAAGNERLPELVTSIWHFRSRGEICVPMLESKTPTRTDKLAELASRASNSDSAVSRVVNMMH